MPTPQPSTTLLPAPPRPRVVAVIPARGGSKGLPRKNIRLLGGKPLIAWSIASALAAQTVDRVVVSTDDADIAEAARAAGAEVPFPRPPELAGDTARVGSAVEHMLGGLARQGERPAVAAILYPTHPFRPAGLIDQLMEQHFRGCAQTITVRAFASTHQRYLTRDGFLTGADGTVYRAYGLVEGHGVGFAGRGRYLHVIEDETALIDIDTLDDLRLAEAALDAGLYTPEAAP